MNYIYIFSVNDDIKHIFDDIKKAAMAAGDKYPDDELTKSNVRDILEEKDPSNTVNVSWSVDLPDSIDRVRIKRWPVL